MINDNLEEQSHKDSDYYESKVYGEMSWKESARGGALKPKSSLDRQRSNKSGQFQNQRTGNASRKSSFKEKKYKFTRARNADRLAKELNTSLHVVCWTNGDGQVSLGLSSHQLESDSDSGIHSVYSVDGSADVASREDTEQQCEEEISVHSASVENEYDAMLEDALHPPAPETQCLEKWPEDTSTMIETITAVNASEKSTIEKKPYDLPPHVQKMILEGKTLADELHSCDIGPPVLDLDEKNGVLETWGHLITNAVQKLAIIMDELKEHDCSTSTCSSVGSTSSGGSLEDRTNEVCRELALAFDNLTVATSSQCLRALGFIGDCFETNFGNHGDQEIQSYFERTSEILLNYRKVRDFETNMCEGSVGPIRIIEDATQQKRRIEQSIAFMKSINHFICAKQGDILQEYNMRARLPCTPISSDEVKMQSKCLGKCWDWLVVVNQKMITLCPENKKEYYKLLLETLQDAAYCATKMQNTPESNNLIQAATSIETHEIEPLSEDEIFGQQWLLACISKLHSYAKNQARTIIKDGSVKVDDLPHLQILKDQFAELMHITVSRMTRSTMCIPQLSEKQLQSRRYYGLETSKLLEKYLKSYLVDRCKEMAAYDIINMLMNNLITNILSNTSQLQLKKNSVMTPLPHQLSLQRSTLEPSEEDPGSTIPWTERVEGFWGGVTEHTRNHAAEPASVVAEADETGSSSSFQLKSPFQCQENISKSLQNAIDQYPASHTTSNVQNGMFSPPELSGSLDMSFGSTDNVLLRVPSLEHMGKVNCQDTEVVELLGSGSSANVYRMKYCGSIVAVKVAKTPLSKKNGAKISREADIHQKVSTHTNIVRYFGKYMEGNEEDSKVLGIVMEHCNFGTLTKAIKEAQWMKELERDNKLPQAKERYLGYHLYKTWPMRLRIIADVAAAMAHLHNNGIMHRDLTSYNILLCKDGAITGCMAKVCDFERSCYLSKDEMLPPDGNTVNSPPWAAPEILNKNPSSYQADVFSIGVILWEMMYLENPWEMLKSETGHEDVVILLDLKKGHRLPFLKEAEPDDFPEFSMLIELVKSTWISNPEERPKMHVFLERIEAILHEVMSRLQSGN